MEAFDTVEIFTHDSPFSRKGFVISWYINQNNSTKTNAKYNQISYIRKKEEKKKSSLWIVLIGNMSITRMVLIEKHDPYFKKEIHREYGAQTIKEYEVYEI